LGFGTKVNSGEKHIAEKCAQTAELESNVCPHIAAVNFVYSSFGRYVGLEVVEAHPYHLKLGQNRIDG
jgi:hypothetical protein